MLILPFFLSSGLPFLTEHKKASPTEAEGSLLKWPLIPNTAIMYKFLAPVLSAQFIKAATFRPKVTLIFEPTLPALPLF